MQILSDIASTAANAQQDPQFDYYLIFWIDWHLGHAPLESKVSGKSYTL